MGRRKPARSASTPEEPATTKQTLRQAMAPREVRTPVTPSASRSMPVTSQFCRMCTPMSLAARA